MTAGPARVSRRRLVLLIGVLAVTAVLVLTDDPKTPEVVPAVSRAAGGPTGAAVAPSSYTRAEVPGTADMIAALKPRVVVARVEDAFVARSWRKPVPVAVVAPPVPPKPEAPAPPYVVLGKQLLDGRWQVFLGLQERTLIVKENDTIDGTWRVSLIKPPSMAMLHLPTGQQRALVIGEGN